ncbi:MAG: Heimdall-CTERM domain-containing surface protein [Candidatus Hodarchaeales archaeon]|jgi:hypothetical protein
MLKNLFNKKITIQKRKKRILFLIGVFFIFSFTSKGILLSMSNANLSEVEEFTSANIPTIELGTPYQGTFNQEEIVLRQTILYFYVNIDQPGIYEMFLTMSSLVDSIQAEFRSIIDIESSFGTFQIPQILDSKYFNNFEEETITKLFFLLHENFDNGVGLSLSIYFDETVSANRNYEVEIEKKQMPKKSNVIAKFNQNEREVREFFSLDLEDLGVTQAGFYNLSALMSVTSTNQYDEYDGDFRIRSIDQMNWYYSAYIYFDSYGYTDKEYYRVVYLDPSQNYYFEAYGDCWMYEGVEEVTVTYQLDATRISSTTLYPDDSVDVPAGQNMLIKIDIPTEDSIRIEVNRFDMVNYELSFKSQYSSYSYSFGNFSNYYNQKRWRTLSYIQLAQRPIDQNIINYGSYGYPVGVFDHIVMGGLVSTYYDDYTDYGDYLRFREEYLTSPINIPLESSDDYLYLSIRSDEDITLNSETVIIPDITGEDEIIDLLHDDPLRIYNIEVSTEDAFLFEFTSELETTSSTISEDDNVITNMYHDNEIQTMNQMLLPGYPFPFISSNGFQLISLKEGTGLFVFSPGYRLYKRVYLDESDPNADDVDMDDIKVEVKEASATAKLVKTKIPETDDLIDIRLNISQPIQFFTFPVDEGAVYNLTVECLPFTSNTYIFITDFEGDNPFYNLEAFTTVIGQSGYLVGRKDTKAYIVIVGYGLVRIHLKKVGVGGRIKSGPSVTPAFELLSVFLILPILVIFRQKQRK